MWQVPRQSGPWQNAQLLSLSVTVALCQGLEESLVRKMTQLSPKGKGGIAKHRAHRCDSRPGLGTNPARFGGFFVYRAERWLLPAQSSDHCKNTLPNYAA